MNRCSSRTAGRAASGLQIDWGVRFDRSRVRATPSDALLLSEQLVSPRVFVTWRPSAERPWTVEGGFARYGIDPTDRMAPFSGASTRVFTYGGPPVNVNAPTVSSADALDILFASFRPRVAHRARHCLRSSRACLCRSPAIALRPARGRMVGRPQPHAWPVGLRQSRRRRPQLRRPGRIHDRFEHRGDRPVRPAGSMSRFRSSPRSSIGST